MSTIAQNKAELVEAVKFTYTKLRNELDDIPENKITEKSMEGQVKNTKMSVHNLVSYLVGWGELVLKWNSLYRQEGKLPDVPVIGYKWSELGKLAHKFYDDYKDDDFSILLRKYDKTVQRVLKMIENKSNKELYEVDWYKKYTLGRMIALNTSSPCKNAYGRVRKWKKQNDLL